MFRYGSFLFLSLFLFLSDALNAPLATVFKACLWGVASAAGQGAIFNSITITNKTGAALSNYPLQFGRPFLAGAIRNQPQLLINRKPIMTQADVKNRYPDGSVEFAIVAVVLPSLPASGSLTLTFQNQSAGSNTPLTSPQMQALLPVGSATMTLTPVSGPTGSADAGQMLADGNCRPWTAGPVAQTMECADDSIARKYDIGFGDGFHPFRPRFYVTFWPATNQVFIRCVGENGLTTEIEDLTYKLSITSNGAAVYSADLSGTQATDPKKHWTGSVWTKKLWIGGAPAAQINIDNNLVYLESTRFIPNFDPTQIPSAATISTTYTNYYVNKPHDIYDGAWSGGILPNGMGVAGDHGDLGPYPVWIILWLHSGDWRLRTLALDGYADLSAAWPMNFRESDPTRRLSRYDPTGLNPSTGLGHTFSFADRPSLMGLGLPLLASYNCYTNCFIKVRSVDSPGANPFTFDGQHQIAPFFIPYILTGDPWYLNEMYMWAGVSVGDGRAGGHPNGLGDASGDRGPDGTYGAISDSPRGEAWVLRNRAETAFAAPDNDPEKAYFIYLTNDALARWEGGVGITGTVFDGSPIKNWGIQYGDSLTTNGGIVSGKAPPLHNTESAWCVFLNLIHALAGMALDICRSKPSDDGALD